jgi:MFS family permease
VGFALFALPSVGASYWKTFLPAVLVLGFGMAVTVAPLTTVVMNSVSQNRVGAASGINNAVARIAGVLAIAILGIIMVKVFGSRLGEELTELSLPPGVLQQIQAEKTKLADLQGPASLDPETKAALADFVKQAFVSGFRVVLLTCASLSLASAAVAGRMIRKDRGLSGLAESSDIGRQRRL